MTPQEEKEGAIGIVVFFVAMFALLGFLSIIGVIAI
jgi:hypothetical protein